MDAESTLGILFAIFFVLAALLVNHFAARKTSILILFLVTLSFTLGFGGIALLPIDLTVTTVYAEGSPEAESCCTPNDTYLPWKVVYWSTAFLGWIILPLFRHALLSGCFTWYSRLQAGCRIAVRGWIMGACAAVLFVVALAVKMKSFGHIVPVLMALGNTYGFLMVVLLLGYSLVDLPKQVWRQANPETELRRTQIVASSADEALFEAVWELQDCEDLIDKAAATIGDSEDSRVAMDPYYARCVDKLLTARKSTAVLSPEMHQRRTTGRGRHEETCDIELDDGIPSIASLAKLNARLERAQEEVVSSEQRWNALVQHSNFYAELANCGGDASEAKGGETPTSSKKPCGKLGVNIRYFWIACLRRPFYRVLGMAFAVMSGAVLWSEATLALPFNVSPFALALRMFDTPGNRDRGFLFQLAALLPILYMSLCVYSSLFKLSNFGPYRLRGNKQSNGIALLFNAQYLVRLQFPLAYNFLFIIKYDTSTTDCAFSHVMNMMSTVPFFGTSFSIYAPLLILALCAFTLCNGYARILGMFGIEHEDAILMGDKETLDIKVNEGIALLRRSTTTRETTLLRKVSDPVINRSRLREVAPRSSRLLEMV